MIASPWTPPKKIGHYRFSDASGASTIKSAWERLLSKDSAGIMSSRHVRLLCIETNEIEKVFAPGGESPCESWILYWSHRLCQGRRCPRTAKNYFHSGDSAESELVDVWVAISSLKLRSASIF